jgi:GTP:adenosylcobinamide-phosphate guanylyltransferase
MLEETPVFSATDKRFNVILLAAGLGTRLRPATDYIPKALISLGSSRAIDYSIRKYQYLAERTIVAVGYCADLLENYVRGKYPTLQVFFSREEPAELQGPGRSLIYALDCASSRLPTLISFCDYVLTGPLDVDSDALAVCKPGKADAILGEYKTLALVEEGVVRDIVPNPDLPRIKENGYFGLTVVHDTTLLKAIAYGAAAGAGAGGAVDFTMDIVRPYVKQVRTIACPVAGIYEFGDEDTLRLLREHVDADR